MTLKIDTEFFGNSVELDSSIRELEVFLNETEIEGSSPLVTIKTTKISNIENPREKRIPASVVPTSIPEAILASQSAQSTMLIR